MISNEDRLYLKKFESRLLGFVQNEVRSLEERLSDKNTTRLKEINHLLQLKACELYGGYDINLLNRKRLKDESKDMVSMILIILCEHTSYYQDEILGLYDKNRMIITRARSEHRGKNVKINHEKKYLEVYKELEKYFLTEVIKKERVDEV